MMGSRAFGRLPFGRLPFALLPFTLAAIGFGCGSGQAPIGGGGAGGATTTTTTTASSSSSGRGGASSSSSSSSGVGGGLESNQCRSNEDCQQGSLGTLCIGPGDDIGCGACNGEASSCVIDDDCKSIAAHYICGAIQCSCEGNSACQPGCQVDADCGAAHLTCEADNRCRGKSCVDASDCPDNFSCSASGSDPRCVRTSCSDDSSCAGYCVKSKCYTQPGYCGDLPG